MKTTSRLALAVALACFMAPAAFAGAGAVASTDQAEVCAEDGRGGSAYSRAHRTSHGPGRAGFEHDHVVPLCLGGADAEANLVWQPLDEAREKDKLEAYACQQVCQYHRVPLAEAQGWFTGGWLAAYVRTLDPTGKRALAIFDADSLRALGQAEAGHEIGEALAVLNADIGRAFWTPLGQAEAGHETAEVLAERKLPGYAAYEECLDRELTALVERSKAVPWREIQATATREGEACWLELHKQPAGTAGTYEECRQRTFRAFHEKFPVEDPQSAYYTILNAVERNCRH